MKNLSVFILFFLLTFASCDVMNGDPIDESQLLGNWTGVAITRGGTPTGENPAKMAFEFKADSTYIRRQGAGKEEGIWHVYNSKLYTTASAAGRHEIFVHIELPSPDTLVIEQLRAGGVKEFWTFKRD